MNGAAHGARTRVLHIVQNLNYGGMERLIAEMARHADHERFDVHVMALGYLGHFAEELDSAAGVHLAPSQSKLSMLRPAALAGAIRRIAPDVVHTHGGVWYKAGRAARMAGVRRIVHTDHGRRSPDPWAHRRIDRAASRRSDVVVAVSAALAGRLRPIVSDPARLTVIENGVDTDRYTPAADDGAFRRALGIEAEAPVIGSIGRLEPIKGYDVAVDAHARLLASWNGSHRPALVLVGDGSERGALERRAGLAGITGDIRFVGWRDNVQEALRAYSVFTMSSHSEGTSVSLLEAMSSGLCPVVTDVGGNAAVLGPELRHRLVPAGDPAALAAAWKAVLEDPTARAADAATARARILRQFSLATMVRRYEELYAASGAT